MESLGYTHCTGLWSRRDSIHLTSVCPYFWNDLIMSARSSHITRLINRAGPNWPWKWSLSQVKITLQGKTNIFNTSLISSVLLLWRMRAFVNPPCKNDSWEEEVTKELNYPLESKLWFVGSTGNKRSTARRPGSQRTWLAVGISMKAVMWFISSAGPSLLPPFPPQHH